MTELEKALHEVLHYLSRARDTARETLRQYEDNDLGRDYDFYQDVWIDISNCEDKIGRVLRRIEKHQKGDKE